MDRQAKSGFTLIETLVVLLVISFCMALLTLSPSRQMIEKIESRIFFNQVLSGLNLAQEISVLQETQVYVRFWQNSPVIQFQIVGHPTPSQEVLIPDFWHIEKSLQFTHFPDGRTNQFGTVVFVHQDGHRAEIVFQLGSGKFEIRQ